MEGNKKIIYIKFGLDFEPIGCLTSNDFTLDVNTFDTTTRVDGYWSNSIPESRSYSFSMEGIYDLTKRSGQTLEELAKEGTTFEWAVGFNGVFYRKGFGFITNFNNSDPVNSKSVFSCSVVGKGDYELIIPELTNALQSNENEALEADNNEALNTD